MADRDDTDPRGKAFDEPRADGGAPRTRFDAAWERGFEDDADVPRNPGTPADHGGAPDFGAAGDPGARPRPGSGGAALPPIPNTGRRAAPRLRVSLPARLITIEGNQPCVLMNLSRSGAQVAVLESVRVGEGAVLRCGSLEAFGDVIRSDFGLNAIRFEHELTDEQVLDIRHYHETFEDRERRSLSDTARKWVTGDNSDERPM
ncbi:MAG: PilZ domain-containing protein [Erythrobacter sp.]